MAKRLVNEPGISKISYYKNIIKGSLACTKITESITLVETSS